VIGAANLAPERFLVGMRGIHCLSSRPIRSTDVRDATIVVIGGILALLGLGFACVQLELPGLQGNLRTAAIAGGESTPMSIVPEQPISAPIETRTPAVAAPDDRAKACQRQLDALLADEMIHFEVLSAAISPSSKDLLEELSKALDQCPDARIEIAGHTDGDGIADLNLKLSEARAESVRNSLIHMGISGDRLVAVGYGSSQPIADEMVENGRQQNRRIEFKVQGIDS
jgi:OmpA-OmpF porin, OOP family